MYNKFLSVEVALDDGDEDNDGDDVAESGTGAGS